jgi:hypothetical protein
MPQTPDEMLSAVRESLTARTGRSLKQWLALVRSSGVDPPDSTRLQPGGPGQATHKVSLRDAREVDAEVVYLLRAAYEQNP